MPQPRRSVRISNDFDNNLRNPCTPDIGADEVTPYSGPALANVSITKTADAPFVASGSQIGFTVRLTNNSSFTATGLTFTDNLPAAPGVNWSIDAANTDAGWSVSGSPPSQSLVYSPTTLAGGTTTRAHVISMPQPWIPVALPSTTWPLTRSVTLALAPVAEMPAPP